MAFVSLPFMEILKINRNCLSRIETGKSEPSLSVIRDIAEYFNIDPTLVRLAWVILSCIGMGTGIVAYIIAAIIIPK